MIYVFLAEGFEEVEALTPVDILRRAGVEVKTVSISDDYIVTGAHGISVMADTTIAQTSDSIPGGWNDAQRLGECDMIVLPGGLPGSTNLDACQRLKDMIRLHYEAGKPLAAICAAPMVYGHMGLLTDRHAIPAWRRNSRAPTTRAPWLRRTASLSRVAARQQRWSSDSVWLPALPTPLWWTASAKV